MSYKLLRRKLIFRGTLECDRQIYKAHAHSKATKNQSMINLPDLCFKWGSNQQFCMNHRQQIFQVLKFGQSEFVTFLRKPAIGRFSRTMCKRRQRESPTWSKTEKTNKKTQLGSKFCEVLEFETFCVGKY